MSPKSLFGKLDVEAAKAAEAKRDAISQLKPAGLYAVRVESFNFDATDDRTPSLNFQLRIIGMCADGKGEEFIVNGQGKPRFANACLFYTAYVSSTALFGLQRLYTVQTGEVMDVEDLISKLEEFTTVAQLKRWVNSWLDTDAQYVVNVRQDRENSRPRNTVSFLL